MLPLRLLLVEDNRVDAELLVHALHRSGLTVSWQRVQTEEEFQAQLESPPDLILADYTLPRFNAPRALQIVHERGLDTPVIVVTGTIGEETAVACLKQGAADYLLKDRLGRLGEAVRRALEEKRLRDDQRAAEEALRLSEMRYRMISELTSDYAFSFRVTPTGALEPEWVTDAFVQITGYTSPELTAQGGWATLIHPEDMPLARRRLERVLGGATDVGEFRIMTKGGEVRWLRDHSQPVWDAAQGRIIRIYGAAQDITMYHQAGDKIRFQAHLLDTVGQAVIATDLELRVLYWNSYATTLYGWTAEDTQGRNLAELLYGQASSPEDTARLIASLTAAGRQSGEFLGRRRDGSTFAADGTSTPILGATGEVVGVVGVTWDISARKEAEAAITQHVAQLSALRSIDLAITASLDVRITLDVVLAHAMTQLGADAADVLLLDPHRQVLEYATGRGLRTSLLRRSQLRLGEGLAGMVALERHLISVPDIAQSSLLASRLSAFAAEGIVSYVGMPLIAKGEVHGVLELLYRSPITPDNAGRDFLELLAGQAALALDNARLFERLQHSNVELTLAYDTTLEGWSHALDLRDKETEGHSRRVTDLTLRLARALDISDEEMVHVRRGALLHDIGKMGIPDAILLKPGPLSDEEWVVMRRHPTLAYELLSAIPYLRQALDIPYCHHEKWDGTGYPRGLAGGTIPLAARLFAVVDVWDALRSDRPYRTAWSEERVRAHIASLAGTHFDPAVVATFLTLDVVAAVSS